MREDLMRYLVSRLLVVPALLLGTGCGDLLDLDINRDPNTATEVPADQLLPQVLVAVASTRSIEIQPGMAEIVQIWAANGSASVFINPERYDIDEFTHGNTWSTIWNSGLKNLKLMRDQALAASPARTNVAAQAEIFSAYLFLMATEIWEQTPYTQALNGAAFPKPVFDEQETVLRGLLLKLDSAVAMVDADGVPGVEFGDLIYGGNMDNWVRFANSLKLRILMLLRNRDTSVDTQIDALLSDSLIRTNAQESAVPFFATTGNENNVWKLNDRFGGFENAGNGNVFFFAGRTLVDLMKQLSDPRLNTYFELARVNLDQAPNGGGPATTEHFGQAAGVSDWNDGETSMVSQNIIRRDWPGRITTASDVWFWEAEFRASRGELGTAHTSYRQGVELALNYFDGKPGAVAAAARTAYLATLPQSFLSVDQARLAINQQQYIEVLDRAPENWTLWRRTKYPTLQPAAQAVLGDVIRRFPMPTAEISSNRENIPPVVPLDRPMWFEK
jgi:hypothetical protein